MQGQSETWKEESDAETHEYGLLDEPDSVLPFLRANLLKGNVDSGLGDALLALESGVYRISELRLRLACTVNESDEA